MAKKRREGFTLYHDDVEMLAYVDDESFKRFVTSLNDYSQHLENAEHEFHPERFDGMAQPLYKTMLSKIERDKCKYDIVAYEQTIKRLMGIIYSEYKAAKKERPSPDECRAMAEQRYQNNRSQPRSTTVDHGQPSEYEYGYDTETKLERESEYEMELPPPTVDQVKQFAAENGLKDDAEKFVTYHSASGWRHGGAAMTDWKAAYHLWLMRGEQYENRPRKKLAAQDYEQRDWHESEMAEKLGVDDLFRGADNGREQST